MTMYKWEWGWMAFLFVFFVGYIVVTILFPPNGDCGYNDLAPGQPFKVPANAYRAWTYGQDQSIEWAWHCKKHVTTHRAVVDRDTIQYLSSW